MVSLGQVQVEVASAAGFRTTQLSTPDLMPYAFTVFWGSEIIRLQEVGSAGKIAYKGALGPQGFHPEEVASFLASLPAPTPSSP